MEGLERDKKLLGDNNILKENNDPILEETLGILGKDHPGIRFGQHVIEHSSSWEVFKWLFNKAYLGKAKAEKLLWSIKIEGKTEYLNKFIQFEKDNIRSKQEVRTTEQFKKIIENNRAEKLPKNNGHSPIIIAKYRGDEKLLDGRKRITMWVDEGNTEPHKVNFHEVIE